MPNQDGNVTRMPEPQPEVTSLEHVCAAYKLRLCVTTIYGRKHQGDPGETLDAAAEAQQAKGVQVTYGSDGHGRGWWREVSTRIRFDYCAAGAEPLELELPLTQFLEIVGLVSPLLGALNLGGFPPLRGPGSPLERRYVPPGIEQLTRL